MKLSRYIFKQIELLILTLLVLSILEIVSVRTNSLIIFSNYLSLLISIGFVSTCLIIYISDEYKIYSFYKRLSIGFASVGILYITRCLSCNIVGPSINCHNNFLLSIFTIDLLQSTLIIWSFLRYNKECNHKKCFFTFLLIDLLLIIVARHTNNILLFDYSSLSPTFIYYILKLLLLSLSVTELIIIKNSKSLVNKYLYYELIIYSILGILRLAILLIAVRQQNLIIHCITILINYIRYFIIFKTILLIIKSPSRTLYNNIIKNKEELAKELNDIKKEKSTLMKLIYNYEEIADLMPEGIGIYKNSRLIYINKTISNFLGIEDIREIVGKPRKFFLSKEDYDKIQSLRKSTDARGVITDYMLRYKDKIIKVNALIFTIIYNSEVYDFTITRSLKQYSELNKKNKLLQQKEEENELKNELLQNITHEFKTPVNVISSCVQMQSVLINNHNYYDIKKYNQFITNNCNRLIKLINNFIDSIEYKGVGIKAERACLNIVPIIEKVTLSVVPFALSNKIKITFDTDTEEIFCNINVDLIDRVMLNLLSNSVKYSDDNGHIFVNIKTDNKTKIVKILVQDNGIGIPKEKMHLLFNRFERMDRTLSRGKEGTGLGLCIVKNIVEFLDGRIHVESKEKVGSTFTIELPLLEKTNSCTNKEQLPNDIKAETLENKINIEFSDIY